MMWEAVIGLEIHVQLATQSKIFSSAATQYGAPPNTQVCAVDLGLPGVLPVLNETVVGMAVKFGLAIGAKIAPRSIFARKNYFYPDLPKGYQISQYELPIVEAGVLSIAVQEQEKTIGITRAHLEEDAGKSLHEDLQGCTGIDLNRAGTPLLEVVSEPDLRSATEAVAYMKKLHALVRYLGICDGNLQEGSFRCDANVSIRPQGQQTLGTRTELKNLNSFRFVEKAINFEIERQIDILENNGHIVQETRLYDAVKQETRAMRSKEEANDYRYFPDPDLLPLVIEPAYLAEIKATLPELPDEKKQRFSQIYGLSSYDANVLTMDQALATYFEETVKLSGSDPKLCANWMMGELAAFLNKHHLEISEAPIKADQLALLLQRISDQTISGKIAKQLFEAMWNGERNADTLIDQRGLRQVTDDDAIAQMIEAVLKNNPQQLEAYRNGKEKLFGFFVGQVMKLSQGKANPAQVNALLKKKLS